MTVYKKLYEYAISNLLKDKEKEYLCHIQFVEQIALNLAKKHGADKDIVSMSALLHDIGRDREKNNETHHAAGVRITEEILNKFDISKSDKNLILKCIIGHGSKNLNRTKEECIITTADSASKILYHQAFMLMCKKETFIERAKWGLKYLEKGIDKVLFDDYKKELNPLYDNYKNIYLKVISQYVSI